MVLLVFDEIAFGCGFGRDERGFARAIRSAWKASGGWVGQYHPGLGASTGQPDLQFLVDLGLQVKVMVPVELKVGVVRGRRLCVSPVRPAQIRWAREFRSAGGKSGFLAGVAIEGSSKAQAWRWGAAIIPRDAVFARQTVFVDGEFVIAKSLEHVMEVILS